MDTVVQPQQVLDSVIKLLPFVMGIYAVLVGVMRFAKPQRRGFLITAAAMLASLVPFLLTASFAAAEKAFAYLLLIASLWILFSVLTAYVTYSFVAWPKPDEPPISHNGVRDSDQSNKEAK